MGSKKRHKFSNGKVFNTLQSSKTTLECTKLHFLSFVTERSFVLVQLHSLST